jgi:hypothetical protein
MENQPLFLDTKLAFEGIAKLAGTLTKLSDNTDLWQQQISQEAYKRLPFMSNYEVSIIMDRIDEERCFAFGSIEVRPRSDMSHSEQKVNPLAAVHIPILVKEQMLYPFDVFIVGKKYYYLTEAKLNEGLFRPEMFDAVRERPPEYALATDLAPPALTSGFGGMGGVKTSSAMFNMPLLPLLDGRVLPEHMERFMSEMADPAVKIAYANAHDGIKAAALSASRLNVSDPAKTAEVAWTHVHPDVVQIKPLLDGNYLMKWANTDMFSPESQLIPPEMASQLVQNTGMASQLGAGETITASPEAVVAQALLAEGIRVIDEFGLWTVQDKNGTALTGWVFPAIMNLDMQPVGLALFTNGSAHALQDRMVGKQVGKSSDLPRSAPTGYGCLYFSQGGKAQAFCPMTVQNKFTGPDGRVKYVGQKITGEPVTFSFSSDVKQSTPVGGNEYLIPATYVWLPLLNRIEVVADPQMFVKTANKNWAGTVEILGDGDVYSLRGAPLAKVAESMTKFVDRDQASFMCVALGMRPDFTKTALDRAARGELVKVSGMRALGSVKEKLAEARGKIKTALANLGHPIRNYCLVKEASVLTDALTADKILGLGFINAENISTFVDMLPMLEEASSNVAEMLMASRLGVTDIPEAALERMIAATEDVIVGLKTLKQREMPLMG